MAARTNPAKGNKPDKVFRDALMVAVKRIHTDPNTGKKDSYINKITAMVASNALDGDASLAALIRDTLDGKPAQAISHTGEGTNGEIKVALSMRPTMTRDEWLATHNPSAKPNN